MASSSLLGAGRREVSSLLGIGQYRRTLPNAFATRSVGNDAPNPGSLPMKVLCGDLGRDEGEAAKLPAVSPPQRLSEYASCPLVVQPRGVRGHLAELILGGTRGSRRR